MKNLITRSLTGIVFVAVILGSLFISKYTFAILFLVIAIGCLSEFYGLQKNSELHPNKFLGYISCILLFIISFLVASNALPATYYLIIFPLLLLIFIAELFEKNEYPLQNISSTVLGVVYSAVPISLSNYLMFNQDGAFSPKLMIALLVIIWIYDSGAYLFGVSLGKHRLFERISPKKSWEGAIGGTLITLIVACFISIFIPEINLMHWLIMAFLIVVSSTFGDLSESMLKRQYDIKDSGQILPGHGGILDRFDSLLFAIPVIVFYLKVIIAK